MAKEGLLRCKILNSAYQTLASVYLPEPPNNPRLIEWDGNLFAREENSELYVEIKPHVITSEELIVWPNQ